jgi:BLOC-1-related complex sub-unit 7
MSSACPQAAKSLFAESKRRLSDRVAVNVNNCASVARQIVRGKFCCNFSHNIDILPSRRFIN